MKISDHAATPLEEWRQGVMTKMRISAIGDARQLCIFEQWCDPGLGAPTHLHAVEEVLEVVAGTAEIWVGDEKADIHRDQSVVIPAGTLHGFKNTGTDVLHVRATLAAPIFEASYEARDEISRRWVPG
ncbi:MAG: cupin domain-containing protein [Paracoccaceae bacterium]|nr:cupin domain-containing protein [Paracoccaceae bacterium]